MDKGTEHAYKWAKGQNYQSVAADYARALAIEIDRLNAELARVTRELGAAKADMRALSDEYKFCNFCRYHNGDGVDTCDHPQRFSCDRENFYEWRGLVPTTPTDRAQGAEGDGEGVPTEDERG